MATQKEPVAGSTSALSSSTEQVPLQPIPTTGSDAESAVGSNSANSASKEPGFLQPIPTTDSDTESAAGSTSADSASKEPGFLRPVPTTDSHIESEPGSSLSGNSSHREGANQPLPDTDSSIISIWKFLQSVNDNLGQSYVNVDGTLNYVFTLAIIKHTEYIHRNPKVYAEQNLTIFCMKV